MTKKKLVSINPANLSIVGEVKFSSEQEIQEKVNQAHKAKQHWKSLGVKKRIDILRPLLQAFTIRKNDIFLLTIKEMGKPLKEVQQGFESDMAYFQAFLDDGADYIADEITYKNDNMIHRIVYEPHGVVAAISPWNFPFSNFIWAVIPNLIVGNTVVFKHSEECPLFGKLVEEVMLGLKELPAGVFSEIYGDAEVGEYLIQQNIDMIWFTGSSAVGKKLSEIAGKKQIKALLEMGGSNPAIVFEDCDVDQVVSRVFSDRFFNCGQVCDAIKRLIVHKSKYQEVVDKLVQAVKQVNIGNPEHENVDLGPLSAMRQLSLLESQMNDALAQGATIMIGGKRPEGLSGAYYLPTILTHIKRTMKVWNEEVFGPVLPVVSFETEEEAVTLANDTIYGLGAVIFSQDIARARRVASQIEAGSIDINQGSHWQPSTPFGGRKSSGMGCEHGRKGFQELCQFKIIAEG